MACMQRFSTGTAASVKGSSLQQDHVAVDFSDCSPQPPYATNSSCVVAHILESGQGRPAALAATRIWDNTSAPEHSKGDVHLSPSTSCLQAGRERLKAVAAVLRPVLVLVPLAILCVCLAFGLWAVFAAAKKEQDSRMQIGHSRAKDKALAMDGELRATYLPTKILSAFVTRNPDFRTLNGTFFTDLAQELVALANTTSTANVQLSPFGIVSAIYPSTGAFAAALGINWFDRRNPLMAHNAALWTIEQHKLTIAGPYRLPQGINGAPARYPIFVKGVDENATFGLDGQPEYLNNYANCSACYNSVTRTKFWGFATVVIDFDKFLHQGVKIDELQDQGYQYCLTRPDEANPNRIVVLSRSSKANDKALRSGQKVYIRTPNNVWTLVVADTRGWVPAWKWPCVAAVVVLSMILSILVFAVLVGRAQQRRLLQEVLESNRCQAEAVTRLQAEQQRTEALLARQYNLIACLGGGTDHSNDMLTVQLASHQRSDLGLLGDIRRVHQELLGHTTTIGTASGGIMQLHHPRDPQAHQQHMHRQQGAGGIITVGGASQRAALLRQQQQQCLQLGIHELLGEGTFGKVFKGTWHGTQVAVKTIVLPAVMSGKAKREKMALMEAIISSSLAHPNVVATYTYDIRILEDSSPEGVTEELQGQALHQQQAEAEAEAGGQGHDDIKGHAANKAHDTRGDTGQGLCSTEPWPAVEGMVQAAAGCGTGGSGSGPTAGPAAVADKQQQQQEACGRVRTAAAPGGTDSNDQQKDKHTGMPAPTPTALLVSGGHPVDAPPSGTPPAAAAAAAAVETAVPPAAKPLNGRLRNTSVSIRSYEVRLVLEFCDKGCLRTALDAGAFFGECGLNYRAILDTAADIAKAMLHLHHNNVLHGDLKSTNVMLKSCGSEGRGVIAKVADFGLSIKMEHTATHVSSTFQGTLTHMAPEVLLQGQVSKAADVYAFGVTLWEIFTSGQPYQGTPCALLGHQISQEGIRPTFPLGTPTAYRELAERCWDKQPAKRPTFDDILAVLTQARQELDGPTPKLADLTPPKVQRKLTDKRISALAIERARGSLGNGASKSRIGSQGPGSQGGPAWPVGHGRAANASRSASSTAGQQLRNRILSMNAAKQQANLLRNGLVVVGSISTSRSAINLEPIREGRPSDEFDTQSRPVASANFQATSNTSTEQQ